jgi:hypothetical protein
MSSGSTLECCNALLRVLYVPFHKEYFFGSKTERGSNYSIYKSRCGEQRLQLSTGDRHQRNPVGAQCDMYAASICNYSSHFHVGYQPISLGGTCVHISLSLAVKESRSYVCMLL